MAPSSSVQASDIGRILVNNPQAHFRTCFGRLHVKRMFLAIITLFVFFEVIESIHIVMNPSLLFGNIQTFIIELVEYLTTFLLVAGYIKESAVLLIPFAAELIIGTIVMFLLTVLNFVAFLFPDSDFANQLLEDYESKRRLVFLVSFLMFTFSSVFTTYCLHVTLLTYRLFEDKQARSQLRESAASSERARGNLVKMDARPPPASSSSSPSQGPAQTVVTQSTPNQCFPNPNFSISDDEDDVFKNVRTNPVLV